MANEYINGYIERKAEGKYEGSIKIEGIDLSPISGVFFKQESESYLWIRRKEMLVYNQELQRYITKTREPRFETYLKKTIGASGFVEYVGEFYFMRFKFKIKAIWDAVFGIEKNRLNLFVERLPMEKQDIINKLRENKIK